jgi:hypothetical protein
MTLADLVRKYLEAAGDYGCSVHLSEFGLPKVETERLISAFDEDYQISRYMIVSREIDAMLTSFPADSRTYMINGYECSHISFEPGIKKLL